jgi:hypothetical protein
LFGNTGNTLLGVESIRASCTHATKLGHLERRSKVLANLLSILSVEDDQVFLLDIEDEQNNMEATPEHSI